MEQTNKHRAGAKRWLARILVPAAVSVALLVSLGGTAFAIGATSQAAPCNKAWSFNPYGATAVARQKGSGFLSLSGDYVVSSAKSWVNGMIDCGPGGYAVAATIDVVTQFRMQGSNLSCSIGYPASFSCSVSGSFEYFTASATCPNATSCSNTFGTLYFSPPPNGSFTGNAWMQTTVTLRRSDGSAYTWQTIWV